ncbi:unnamed protein product, partial [marine sediment metagenome]
MVKKKELFEEKSMLILDQMIYPNNFINILRSFLKKPIFTPEFFGRGYVRLIVICDTNEDRLDEKRA